MFNLVNFYIYRYVRICRKKGKVICRFNFFLFLMLYIVVLDFLYNEEKMFGKENFQKVVKFVLEVKIFSILGLKSFYKKLK